MSDMPSDPAPGPDAVDPEEGDGLIERLRGTGAGVEDPTIVGDSGPVDRAAVRADASSDDDLPVATAEDGDPGQV